ncbi:MAG: NADH-ubiquinone oxidoreductase-F iron-sulfur binding region domain-containing protein [Candidatus Nanopelagicales bacterium]
MLIEGMVIAAYAVGAGEGYVYIRSEYPDAVRTMRRAIGAAAAAGWLGADILGSGFSFDLQVRVGAGAYICGEETRDARQHRGQAGDGAGQAAAARDRGPLRLTVINNVLTLATVPAVVAQGAEAYAASGVGRSRGTQVFQLAGNVARGGIVETAFGLSLAELVEGYGGGTTSGRPVKAVQVGGPLGAYVPASAMDVAMGYEELAAIGAMLGHGGVVVFDDTADMGQQARFAMEFCAEESCGKCTPCRIGAVRGVEVIDRILVGPPERRADELVVLEDLCELMAEGSLCAMGGLTPNPVRSVIRHFPGELGAPLVAPAAPGETGTP